MAFYTYYFSVRPRDDRDEKTSFYGDVRGYLVFLSFTKYFILLQHYRHRKTS